MARILLLSVAALTLLLSLGLFYGDRALGEKLYKWKDERGVWHITNDPDKVPKDIRPSSVQTEGARSMRQRLRAYYARARQSRAVHVALVAAGAILIALVAVQVIKRYRQKRAQGRIKKEIEQYERRSRQPIKM